MLKLSRKALDWALKHIERDGDTFKFPIPFEFTVLRDSWTTVGAYLEGLDVYSEGIRTYRTCLVPKGLLGFRVGTQLDPLDSIVCTAIIVEMWEDIESARVPIKDQVVFSNRLRPMLNGTLYDANCDWNEFQAKCRDNASQQDCSYVVLTDIADFFPSLYLHNIETCLNECTRSSGRTAHADVLVNRVKAMHLMQTHRGLPVGPHFARPIAELCLTAIDQALLQKGVLFARYVDDYRIFCSSESEAYETLTFLARQLHDQRNLKLNAGKTQIVPAAEFLNHYNKDEQDKADEHMVNTFELLLERAGIDKGSYEPLDWDALPDKTVQDLRAVNLRDFLEAKLDEEEPVDYAMISWLLANLARVDDSEAVHVVLRPENLRKLRPMLMNVIRFLGRLRSLDANEMHAARDLLLEQCRVDPFVGGLEYNRAWIFDLLAKDREWANGASLSRHLRDYTDEMTHRKLLLSLGQSGDLAYFRANKGVLGELRDWERRAFIVGISCLPKDERRPWYKARQLTRRDPLDVFVEDWASKNPLPRTFVS